jgi:hypothetical protein
MSLRVNKDNIFFILPESRYAVSERIDKWMEEDFTLYVKCKVHTENFVKGQEGYIIARNGMHSGISIYNDDYNCSHILFTYWFKKTNENGETEFISKQVHHKLEEEEKNLMHEYVMVCDNYEERKIDCYMDSKLVGTITFDNLEKASYEHSFYWFGCGSMIGPEEHQYISDVEFDLCFLLNIKQTMDEIIDIVDNYEDKYSHIVFNDLKKLNYDYPLRKHFAFLCNFNQYNRYKIWDACFSGNYPQFYIEKNIYF